MDGHMDNESTIDKGDNAMCLPKNRYLCSFKFVQNKTWKERYAIAIYETTRQTS